MIIEGRGPMKKPKVLISRKIPKEVEEYIGRHCDYTIWEGETKLTYDTILDKIHDVEGLLLSMIRIDKNLLDHAPNLKVVSNFSVGYNNFDIDDFFTLSLKSSTSTSSVSVSSSKLICS